MQIFLIGNGITCSYSLLSMFLVCLLGRNCVFHLVDMLAMGLAIASAAAAHAIGNVGKYGNDRTGWLPVCNYYKSYCKKMEISLGCCYLGVLSLYLVCAMTRVQKASQNSKKFVQKE
uniref:CASP-like protein n=1 Tax=Ananas comosus var. bracteatus TaxID=296719 RepID=A0A6V7QVZ0_ANACO